MMKGENHPNYGKRGENNPNYGKPLSEETKNKISEKLTGRKFSEEHLRKMREAAINYRDSNIYCFMNTITGEQYIGTPYDFCKKYNIDRSSVSKLIRNKIKNTKKWVILP